MVSGRLVKDNKNGKQVGLASARSDQRRKFLFSQLEMTVLPVVTSFLYRLLVPGPLLGKRSIEGFEGQ